jgi:hypothetical protein
MDKSTIHLPISYLAIILLLLALCTSAFAVDSLYVMQDLPEITELEYDTLELQYWLADQSFLQSKQYQHQLKLDSRHIYKPDAEQLTSRFLLSASSASATSLPTSVTGLLYQKLRKNYETVNQYQFSLFAHPGKVLKTISLGHFRLQAGEGLVLGSYQKSKASNALIIPAQGLSHPALTGAAIQASLLNMELALWLSQNSRVANVQAEQIHQLYESSLITTNNKETALEKSSGLVTGYFGKNLHLGGYYYQQSYNYTFSDADIYIPHNTSGIFGELKLKPIKLGFETNKLESKYSRALSLEYKDKGLTHNLKYFYKPQALPFAYAKTQQVFGQKTGMEEISWDCVTRFPADYMLTTRIAAVKDLTGQAESRWKERLIVSIRKKEVLRSTELTLYRYRKETLSVHDTTSAELLSIQHRIKAQLQQQLSHKLRYHLSCQYQHYLAQKFIKNGFSLQQSIHYNTPKTDIGLAFTAWTNQKSIYQSTELLSADEMLIQADTDTALQLKLSQKIGKSMALHLNIYRPFQHTSKQSYGLQISAG